MTGSSAARLMLLSRMKNRMRLVKMLWLTILWHVILNLQNRGGAKVEEVTTTHRTGLPGSAVTPILVGVAEDKEGAGFRHGNHLLL